MQDILKMLEKLCRPRLMMRAARIGAEDYRRGVHLPRLLGYGALPGHSAALMKLMQIEAALEDSRSEGDASYSLIKHIDVLIAVVGEARVLRAARSSK